MKCAEAKTILIDLVYDELNSAESAALHEHLHACETCRQEFARLQNSREQLNAIAERPVRIDLARLCLRGAEQWEHSRRRWRRIGYLSAAAVVLIAVVFASQVRYEFHDGQMLIVWHEITPPARPIEPRPAIQSPPAHLVSADYLRLRTQVVDQGPDAVFNVGSPAEDRSETPRSYRKLRDQLFQSIDPPSESSI